MMPQLIMKLIVPKLMDLLIGKFKLDKVKKYVEEENELDRIAKDHEERIKKLES